MSLTSGLSDWLWAQGIWCPEGDGDTLRTAAAAWTAMGEAISDIGTTLDTAGTTLGATTTGTGTSTFATYWDTWSGDTGFLAVSAAYCSQLATALIGFATDVDVASTAVLEGIEWAIASSNLGGPTTFTPGVIPDAVPPGITPAAIAELKTAIEQYAAQLGAAAQNQAASAGVTAIDPTAPPATSAAPVTTSTIVNGVVIAPLGAAPDLGSLATTTVDFGAGQGTVLDPSGAPVALPAPPPTPTMTSASFDQTLQGTAVSNPDPLGAGSVLPASATVLTAPMTSVAKPTAMLAAALGIGKAVRAVAGSASSLEKSQAGVGAGGGGAMPSFSTPPLATIPTSKIDGTPVSVPPPSAATLAAEKAAEDAAKAAATGKASGSMPFMPMGMGGAGAGGGGDDRDEARRKKRR